MTIHETAQPLDEAHRIVRAFADSAKMELPDSAEIDPRLQPLIESLSVVRGRFEEREIKLREAVHRERTKSLDLETLADRLEQSGQKLQEANDELEAFAYSASHDMAAPLRVIEGLSRILIEDYGDALDENGNAHLETIHSSADRLIELLKDLLVLSRVRTPSKEDIERVHVGELVDGIARDRKDEFGDQARIIIGGTLPVVEAPAQRVRQVLENLITNGFKYNDAPQPTVTIEGWTEGSIGVIRVEDNGIGIPEHLQDECFGLFTRLHTDRTTPGTGAGLAIAKRAIRSLGGEMWIEGSSDQGTSFVVAVPTHFAIDRPTINWSQIA